jgi:hypothetical protein
LLLHCIAASDPPPRYPSVGPWASAPLLSSQNICVSACAQSIFSCGSEMTASRAEDGAARSVENTSNSSEKLRKNFEWTSKELRRNFERKFEVYFEVLRRIIFNFFRSSDFLCSTLLIEEFQISVVGYSNIRTYSNYSNFPAAPFRESR